MYFLDKHKTITSYYELLSGEVCDQYELTQMEYDILIFLHNNPRHNTAAEIVKIRKSTKSHVSSSLKNLASRGLDEEEACNLMARAKLDALCSKIGDEELETLAKSCLEEVTGYANEKL